MANLPSYRDTDDDTSMRPDHESPPSVPTWVKILGISFLMLIVVLVILHLAGGGMRMHGGRALPDSITEYQEQRR